jgi:hypothetical protein
LRLRRACRAASRELDDHPLSALSSRGGHDQRGCRPFCPTSKLNNINISRVLKDSLGAGEHAVERPDRLPLYGTSPAFLIVTATFVSRVLQPIPGCSPHQTPKVLYSFLARSTKAGPSRGRGPDQAALSRFREVSSSAIHTSCGGDFFNSGPGIEILWNVDAGPVKPSLLFVIFFRFNPPYFSPTGAESSWMPEVCVAPFLHPLEYPLAAVCPRITCQ